MKVELTVKHYFPCPQCKEQFAFSIEHLLAENTTFGPWYCDYCGQGVRGTVKDGTVDIEEHGKKLDTLVLLKCNTDPKLFIVAKGMRFGERSEEDHRGGARYFYEEGTCPSNYFEATVAVMHDGDTDPHGLFNYVKEVTLPPRNHQDPDEERELAEELLQSVFSKVQP